MLNEKFVRVLHIDLTSGAIRINKREDLVAYLGGVGIASKLLEENMRADLPPLAPEQPIILAIGAASSIFPIITKTCAMFISPLTDELGESYAGGRLALTMFHTGLDAIVITGKAARPSYISVRERLAEIKDARAFWGMTSDAVGQYIRQRESFSGKRSILRIGPAGEKLCHFASVCVDSYRHFGRLGLGAVFGSKNLKALIVAGERSIPILDFKKYNTLYSKLYKTVTGTEIMSKYHDIGTPINIKTLNAGEGLPVNNLTATSTGNAEILSGEAFATNNLVRKMACTSCPVGCIHLGQFRREFDSGHEYEAVTVSYDYELIYALGTFLGIGSTDDVLKLIEIVEEVGVDAMSCGVALGWATEAYQKNLLRTDQTIVPLEFGNTDNYIKAVTFLSDMENEFYADLAKGVRYAAQKYGGYDFGMQIAGNEMPGYHTGYGSLMGAAVGARHSHLCNGGYSFDQSKPFEVNALIDYIFEEELERCLLNSLTICLFARKLYDREIIRSVLDCIGKPLTDEELDGIARRIYRTKLRIKNALGFKLDDIRLPKRFFETPSMTGRLDEETAMKIRDGYSARCSRLLEAAD